MDSLALTSDTFLTNVAIYSPQPYGMLYGDLDIYLNRRKTIDQKNSELTWVSGFELRAPRFKIQPEWNTLVEYDEY